MRKIIFIISMIISLITFPAMSQASISEILSTNEENNVEDTAINDNAHSEREDITVGKDEEDTLKDANLNNSSEEVMKKFSKKERRIAELSDKYNDKGIGTIAYYLEVARYYSTPIFFIFLTIGAFNFFIVGNKKLDKKEQGFGWITACIIGWVVFQCIPLIFAIFNYKA